jgi:hypothetical protein
MYQSIYIATFEYHAPYYGDYVTAALSNINKKEELYSG